MNFLKKLFILIFLYAIFEGAFRKWFTSNYDFQLILIRDFLIIVGVIYGITKKIYDFNQIGEKFLIIYTLSVLLWIIIQLTFSSINFLIYFIGIRNWILYVWFSFLFLRAFNEETISNIIKIILITVIPLSILSIFQHYAPLDHFINTQIFSELDYVIYPNYTKDSYIAFVTPDIVRTSSAFTYHYGYSQYLKLLCPLVVLLIDNNKFESRFSNKYKFFIITFFLLAIVYSGSRQTVIFFLFMLFTYLILKIYIKDIKDLFKKIIFIFFLIFIFFFFIDRPIDAIYDRFLEASNSESIFSRISNMLFGTSISWDNFTYLGQGIGIGSNISSIFLGNTRFFVGEFETDRILGEGGILGIILIFLKYIFSFIYLKKTFKILNSTKEIFPFMFAIFIAQQLTLVQISGQLTTQVFTFLSLGLFLSVVSVYNEKIFNIKKSVF